MVKPSDFSRAMVWPICWMMTGARPSVGSSSIRKRAPVRRIRAIASICCSPPDNLVPWLLSRSLRLGNSSKIWSSDNPPLRTIGGNSRFSRTSRLAKIPRSSGQMAMPWRAILSDDARMVSWPLKRTEPVRLPTIPMIDFSVVVLPAPLRPSSVTTSPASTWKLTPCSTWDSPYHACKLSTASSWEAGALTMPHPHIGLAHFRIGGNRLVVALGENASAGQHRDAVGQRRHDAEIMLDHQHGAVHRHRLDEARDAVDVFMAHAGGRLVEQQHFGIERQRGGE